MKISKRKILFNARENIFSRVELKICFPQKCIFTTRVKGFLEGLFDSLNNFSDLFLASTFRAHQSRNALPHTHRYCCAQSRSIISFFCSKYKLPFGYLTVHVQDEKIEYRIELEKRSLFLVLVVVKSDLISLISCSIGRN